MLSKEDNELLCRVGPGTAMGNLLRQYWIPAFMPSELEPDSAPMRLRLLGEDLIAFRVTSGAFGLIQNSCPHRGASMFFGRNEEEGLRCVYHGWKFDVTGACVDMPSEPAESNFKNKVRTRSYPCVERNAIVWTYMGPAEVPPTLPELPSNMDPNCRVNQRLEECNFMQALEGDIDTVHAGFLHAGHIVADRDLMKGSCEYYAYKNREARFESYEHVMGGTYAAVRPAEEGTEYWRTGHYLLPFYTMNAPGVLAMKNSCQAWVPLDDYNTMVWLIGFQQFEAGASGIGGLMVGTPQRDPLGKEDPYRPTQRGQYIYNQYLPASTDALGRFRPIANKRNDYYIDRDLQAHIEYDGSKPQTGTYTGIARAAQDPAAQESMGAIYDRTQERLGTTDTLIIRARRKMLNAAKALRDNGTLPPGVEDASLFRMRSGGAILPSGLRGLDVLKPIHLLEADDVKIPAEAVIGGGS